tara:strand:- start:13472 stop:16273 length:2802 start_codon:yes stop_codon:yes gene_type:complete
MSRNIFIRGAKIHNLKNINVEIPGNKLTVISGLSGSGKSSLAFDTLYSEGRRLYLDSLSTYARQFLGDIKKANVDSIEGISPAIAINQAPLSKNPRSTVGTATELLDFLRLLYGRVGIPYCPDSNKKAISQNPESIIKKLLNYKKGKKYIIYAPLERSKKGEFKNLITALRTEGYSRLRINKSIYSLDEKIILDKNKKHDIDLVIDRLIAGGDPKRISRSVKIALKKGKGQIIIEDQKTKKEEIYSELFISPKTGKTIPNLNPRFFSFNSPEGACKKCKGIGIIEQVDIDALIDWKKSLIQGGIKPLKERLLDRWHQASARGIIESFEEDPSKPLKDLKKKVLDIIIYGSREEKISYIMRSRRGKKYHFNHVVKGISAALWKKMSNTKSPSIKKRVQKYISQKKCTKCKGKRLKPEALAARFSGKKFSDISRMSLEELHEWAKKVEILKNEKKIVEPILLEVKNRLDFLVQVGVGYLELDRLSSTLSGGESKRIKLAKQIGGKMSGVLYVLDEPTIGLHPTDTNKLIKSLNSLVALDNTVVVVEHDPKTIKNSNHLIEIGPGAGHLGGKIIYEGSPRESTKDKKSLIGRWLNKEFSPKKEKRKLGEGVVVKKAKINNLKNISVSIPSNGLTVLCGPSGSGKSSLLEGVLNNGYKEIKNYGSISKEIAQEIKGINNYEKIELIDQSPIGRTPRSNPATYTDIFTIIRNILSKTPEAQSEGYTAGFFSFNISGGRCESCNGSGYKEVEMHFLADISIKCPTCEGQRYGQEALAIKYKGLNISQILELSVKESIEFFKNFPPLRRRLEVLEKVGLGYISLGQSATTLSGGEAQRLKLSKHLGKNRKGKSLILLDEPTTGLHPDDIENLKNVFDDLVEQGNTLLVIEHNLQVLSYADWIIEMGEKGGNLGGKIVFEGTMNQLKKTKTPTAKEIRKWK